MLLPRALFNAFLCASILLQWIFSVQTKGTSLEQTDIFDSKFDKSSFRYFSISILQTDYFSLAL